MDCEYIEHYFKCGFTTNEILHLLAVSKLTFERIFSYFLICLIYIFKSYNFDYSILLFRFFLIL